MLQIMKIGENTMHDYNFFINRPSGHPVYLLLLVKTPARFYVDNQWVDTFANTAFVFKPGQMHLYGASQEFTPLDQLAYMDDWIHIKSPTSILPEYFPFGRPITLHSPDEYYELFHLINNEFYGATPHKNAVLNALTSALLNKLLDACNTEEYPPLYYKLVSLREQIYSYPQNEWHIDDMAKSLCISSGYLHYIYKHFFNTTCISDVIHSRIQASCELLVSTGNSVEEISILCGYHNTEHFIRQFKKIMVLTPSEYRKTAMSD